MINYRNEASKERSDRDNIHSLDWGRRPDGRGVTGRVLWYVRDDATGEYRPVEEVMTAEPQCTLAYPDEDGRELTARLTQKTWSRMKQRGEAVRADEHLGVDGVVRAQGVMEALGVAPGLVERA